MPALLTANAVLALHILAAEIGDASGRGYAGKL